MGNQESGRGLLLVSLLIFVNLLAASPSHLIGLAVAADATQKAKADDTIDLQVGKAQLVRLSVTPDVVMVGNPAIADVVVEDNGLLFLLGQEPGETNLLVLNKAGKVILSSPVVVGPLTERRVTVDRGPEVFTLSCNPRCVPVATPEGTGATTAAAAPGAAAPGGQAVAQDAGGGADGGPGGANAADIANALSGLVGNLPASQ